MTTPRDALAMALPVAGYVHAHGDDFDGCSTCWDNQHAEGIPDNEIVPCCAPVPSRLVGGIGGSFMSWDDLDAAMAKGMTADCQNCMHPVALA